MTNGTRSLFCMSFIFGSFFIAGCLSDGGGGSGGSGSSTAPAPIETQFKGADSATNLDDTSIQIQWTPITSDSKIVLYRIYSLNPDGSLQALSSVDARSSLYIHSGLTSGNFYNYVVRAADANGGTDKNMNIVSALTYAGVTSSQVISATSANLVFPAAPAALNLNIYCASGSGSSTYNLMATVGHNSTSYTLTGLTSGTQYTCKVRAKAQNSLEDSNLATTSFTPSASPGNPSFGFSGISGAINLNGTANQISWSLGTGSMITGYRIYQSNADGSLTALNTVSAVTTTYTHGGPEFDSSIRINPDAS